MPSIPFRPQDRGVPVPRRFRRIKQRVSELDRRWFERHPTERQYVRPHVPGECWPNVDPECTATLVTQVVPDLRVREGWRLKTSPVSGRVTLVDSRSGLVAVANVLVEGPWR